MSEIKIGTVTVEANQSALRRDGDHVTMIVPAQLAVALKTACECMSIMLLDPELHKDGDKKRMAVAIEDSLNLVSFAQGLASMVEDELQGAAS